jgi:hypothetical protein
MSEKFNLDPQPAEQRPDVQRPVQPSPSSYNSSGRSAQFYTPPPSAAQPASSVSSSSSRWRLAGLGVVVAVALGSAAWYGMATHGGTAPIGGNISAVAASAPTQKTFSVSNADLDQKATDELKALLSGDSTDSSKAADALHAVNAQSLRELGKTNPQMADDIKSGRRVLYRVHLLDFLDEDGDHAELFVNGVGLGDVYLRNAGTEILIPLAAGVPTQMKLLATTDGGGGGVTVGFVSSLGEVRTRIMQVGEFEEWQVTVR